MILRIAVTIDAEFVDADPIPPQRENVAKHATAAVEKALNGMSLRVLRDWTVQEVAATWDRPRKAK